jgi:prepilin-type N-terminal cleavage/methylation domain-containing protein
MNNKGFSLVELLATITILGIIIAIGVVSYNKINISSKEETRKNIIKKIEIAASNYAFDTNITCVQVSTLITNGYLEEDTLDPLNNSSFNNNYVRMTKTGNYYNAEFLEEGNCS